MGDEPEDSMINMEGFTNDDIERGSENDFVYDYTEGTRDMDFIDFDLPFSGSQSQIERPDKHSAQEWQDSAAAYYYYYYNVSDNDSSAVFDDSTSQRKTNVTESWRFDPMASSNKSSWSLSEGQSNFVDKYFCDKYVGDTALKETVLKDQPKPNHKGLQALKLDPDMVDLLPRQAQHPST